MRTRFQGACRRIPSSARERAVFSPGKDGDLSAIALAKARAGDVGVIVEGAGAARRTTAAALNRQLLRQQQL